MIEEDKTCTACEGTGKGLMMYPANTKIVTGGFPPCKYCNGTGERQSQVFNWMKDPEPEKYLKKAKKVKL